jgi:hypothetical protein
MLAVKPEDRLTLEAIKNHPWYTGDVLLLNDIFEEFTEKRKFIEKKKEEEQAGTRGMGDLSEVQIAKLNEDYTLDESLIQKVDPDNKSYVLKIKPAEFYAKLKYLFTVDDEEEQIQHRILEDDVDEVYSVSTIPNSTKVL